MDENKLRYNFSELSKLIVRKPTQYTPERAIRFRDAFNHYTKTNTIHIISAMSDMLAERGWPYPSFIAREAKNRPEGLLEYINIIEKKREKHKWSGVEGLYKMVDTAMPIIFDYHKKMIFDCWRTTPILIDKISIISQIQKCYDMKLWIACISTAFPILDYLIRDYFKTTKLDRDINRLLAIFRNAGFTSSKFKPGFDGYNKSDKTMTVSDFIQQDLRLIGIGLSSFVDTASIYYQYYRKDFMAPESEYPLNRHAVIHSASSDFNTKENAVRLLTFIDLTLELEFAFRILLKEE
ncbi:MAG: hypothetical protein CL946_06975 [Ectothiorhodospiraceae bacterium]|nr:hypothetical protein [Ectothiorhodospiraceae bacterium]